MYVSGKSNITGEEPKPNRYAMNFYPKSRYAYTILATLTLVLLLVSGAVQAQDDCATAVPITTINNAAAGCVTTTAGTTIGRTQSMPGCVGTADDDTWFRFVPDGGTITITITGTGITNPVFEVFSGTCGSLTSILCQNASATNNETGVLPANLVNGTTYYVRVYSFGNSGGNRGTFTICLRRTDPPTNDNCATATSITPGNCTGTQTLVGATNSGLAAGCGGSADDDVWYRFTATSVTHPIRITNIGSSVAVSGAGIGGTLVAELLSTATGTCVGPFTTRACAYINGTNLEIQANSLTIGTQYFIRVYSFNSVSLTANAGFRVCVDNPPSVLPTLFLGKSFINVTKGIGGGTVETGDILEIRASVTLRQNGGVNSALDSCAFFDNVPAGTAFVPGSLAILTNEGKVYKGFTDAAGDDAGRIVGSAITINMGYNTNDNPATATRKGRIRNTNIPTVGGNSCVMLVSYRVTVTATTNSIINLGGGTFTYSQITNPTVVLTQNYNQNNVIVYTNTGLCNNSTGVNVLDAGLPGDFNGTFGTGNTMNRVASPNMPPGYTYTQLVGSAPGDFFYGIPNNTSNNPAGYSTVNTWPKPESPATHRIFGVWDVIGDHTGATNQLLGNPAADTTGGGMGGYMLLVNAAYNLDTVFKYPISGLCPETYYEISFWVRNMCSRCGMDSLGRGASGTSVPAGYIPTDVGDSSGVYPNLSFSINDVNHYTTGNIRYTGEWVKKGFVFRTGVGQTSIVFAIANNAPGGGGNDWALDDISVSTCTPNLNLSPSGNAQVCYGNQVDINCQVVSYFDNYVYYQWQVSHDNGATWTDTLTMGTGTPVPSGGNYVYTASFPSFLADSAAHLVQYRIRVATNPTNLYGGCSFYNSANIIVLVNGCQFVLKTNLVSFDAVLKNKHAALTWKTANETDQTKYEIQKSLDGTRFVPIGTVKALGLISNTYTFNDPEELQSFAYYRIAIQEPTGRKNSKIKLLNVSDAPYEIISVVNPFREKLSFEMSIPQASMATIVITDQHGKTVRVAKQQFVKGVNQVEINDLGNLSNGTYILKVITDSGSRSRKLVKINN